MNAGRNTDVDAELPDAYFGSAEDEGCQRVPDGCAAGV